MYLSMLISTWYKIIHIVNTYKCDAIFLYICPLWSELSLTVWVSYCGLSSQTTCRSFSSLSFGRVCEISEKMISIKFSCSLLWKRDIRIDLYSRVKRRPRAAPLRRNTSREAKKIQQKWMFARHISPWEFRANINLFFRWFFFIFTWRISLERWDCSLFMSKGNHCSWL